MSEVTVKTLENLQIHVEMNGHTLLADEPLGIGDDKGPTPYDLLLSALGSCTAMTLLMYARRKDWPLEDVEIDLSYDRVHAEDCENVENEGGLLDRYMLNIRLIGEIDEEKRERLAYIATRCPVRKTLAGVPRFEETVSVYSR